MKENRALREVLKDMNNKEGDQSWFGDTPHYWAEASLPLAYAVACVEVVCESSEKARMIYNELNLFRMIRR